MDSIQEIIKRLESNASVFQSLLQIASDQEIRWRQDPEKWSMLEIVCHLYDEERDDFRTRVKFVLEDPDFPLPRFDPIQWIEERSYAKQDYHEMVAKFLGERNNSVAWLKSLKDPQWNNTHHDPKLGPMSAGLFLTNWLAHDYFHFRQITRLKYAYLNKALTDESLDYAGKW